MDHADKLETVFAWQQKFNQKYRVAGAGGTWKPKAASWVAT